VECSGCSRQRGGMGETYKLKILITPRNCSRLHKTARHEGEENAADLHCGDFVGLTGVNR
jgi:hypothetical protein